MRFIRVGQIKDLFRKQGKKVTEAFLLVVDEVVYSVVLKAFEQAEGEVKSLPPDVEVLCLPLEEERRSLLYRSEVRSICRGKRVSEGFYDKLNRMIYGIVMRGVENARGKVVCVSCMPPQLEGKYFCWDV